MAVQLATFGSVFKYKENYFVYFTMTPEGDRVFAPKTSPTVVTTPAINTPTVTPTVTTETPKVAWWKKILNLLK
jgi:hypothetical protein